MHVHGSNDTIVSTTLREQRIWEPYETRLFLKILKPGGVVVDVGANLGYFSVLAAALVGESGRVMAFEPDPANFRLLQENIALNEYGDRVTTLQAGLAEEPGAGHLYLSEDNLGDHRIFRGEGARQTCDIQLLNGSEVLRGQLPRIDLLKVDTQGSEYSVIAGLLPLLLEMPGKPQVLVELTPFALRQAGSSGRALIALLERLEQPFWIVDHIEHQLVASNASALARWCDNVDACSPDEGFMNILVGEGL